VGFEVTGYGHCVVVRVGEDHVRGRNVGLFVLI
jgi:hypothetical protein